MYGHLHTVKLVDAHGAPVNALATSGRTALHLAADNGKPDAAAALVTLGADVTLRDTKSE